MHVLFPSLKDCKSGIAYLLQSSATRVHSVNDLSEGQIGAEASTELSAAFNMTYEFWTSVQMLFLKVLYDM